MCSAKTCSPSAECSGQLPPRICKRGTWASREAIGADHFHSISCLGLLHVRIANPGLLRFDSRRRLEPTVRLQSCPLDSVCGNDIVLMSFVGSAVVWKVSLQVYLHIKCATHSAVQSNILWRCERFCYFPCEWCLAFCPILLWFHSRSSKKVKTLCCDDLVLLQHVSMFLLLEHSIFISK